MAQFFINYTPADKRADVKETIEAPDAMTALASIGYPEARVWCLYHYVTPDEFDAMLAANPLPDVPPFEDWESEFGDAESSDYLWTRPRLQNVFDRHPMLDGRGSPHVCAKTGHVRRGSIGEFYGNWTEPKNSA